MPAQLNEIFPRKYHNVLNSILPGGARWHKEGYCLNTCPYYTKCEGYGPSQQTLCTTEWGSAGTRVIVWMVLKHIFDNFDYYNLEDIRKSEVTSIISEITEILNFDFDKTLSPSEARAIVKVRLRQAEFKANLFELWGGCSLSDINVGNRYLIASHILPWSKANDSQKVSKFNGLLLPPNYDYLFDRHLISFSAEGLIILQNNPTEDVEELYRTLGIDRNAKLKTIYTENTPYFKIHKDVFSQIESRLSDV